MAAGTEEDITGSRRSAPDPLHRHRSCRRTPSSRPQHGEEGSLRPGSPPAAPRLGLPAHHRAAEPVPPPPLFPAPPQKSPCRWVSSSAGSASRGGRQLLGRAGQPSVAGCPSHLPSPLPRSLRPPPGAGGTALEDAGTCSLSLGVCQSPTGRDPAPR